LERHYPRLGSRLDRGPARLDGQQGTSILGDDAIQSSERGSGTCGNQFYAEPDYPFLQVATLTTISERITEMASVEAMLALGKREGN